MRQHQAQEWIYRSLAVVLWNNSINIMDVPYHTVLKILGTHFTTTVRQSACKNWSAVADSMRSVARDAYYRELWLEKRILYVHNYLLAIAWYTTQIFPMPDVYTPQSELRNCMVYRAWKNIQSTATHSPKEKAAGWMGSYQCWGEEHFTTFPLLTNPKQRGRNNNIWMASKMGPLKSIHQRPSYSQNPGSNGIHATICDGYSLHFPKRAVGM